MARFKVGYFVGSLATRSINRLLARALVRVAPADLQLTEISFKDLPLYSYDHDSNYPPVATAFKDAIAAVDAVRTPPQHSCLLQFASDELDRGIHSVRGRPDQRGRERVRRVNKGVPPELHVRVSQFHRARLYRIAAQYLEVFGDGGIEHTARFLRLHPDRTELRPTPLRRGSS